MVHWTAGGQHVLQRMPPAVTGLLGRQRGPRPARERELHRGSLGPWRLPHSLVAGEGPGWRRLSGRCSRALLKGRRNYFGGKGRKERAYDVRRICIFVCTTTQRAETATWRRRAADVARGPYGSMDASIEAWPGPRPAPLDGTLWQSPVQLLAGSAQTLNTLSWRKAVRTCYGGAQRPTRAAWLARMGHAPLDSRRAGWSTCKVPGGTRRVQRFWRRRGGGRSTDCEWYCSAGTAMGIRLGVIGD